MLQRKQNRQNGMGKSLYTHTLSLFMKRIPCWPLFLEEVFLYFARTLEKERKEEEGEVYWKSLVDLEVPGLTTVFSHVFYMQSACKRLTILYSHC